jgi:hypothetical protein
MAKMLMDFDTFHDFTLTLFRKRPVSNGVRGMEVCIPNVDAEGTTARPVLKPPSDLNKYFKRVQLAGAQNEMLGKRLFILHEKASRYDALSSCLVDFRGRANIASVKNFQLIPVSVHAYLMKEAAFTRNISPGVCMHLFHGLVYYIVHLCSFI